MVYEVILCSSLWRLPWPVQKRGNVFGSEKKKTHEIVSDNCKPPVSFSLLVRMWPAIIDSRYFFFRFRICVWGFLVIVVLNGAKLTRSSSREVKVAEGCRQVIVAVCSVKRTLR